MHCFRQSGEETFIIVVNYDCKALILSKKMRDLAASTLPNSFSKIRHRLALELDCSRTAVQIATKICPVNFQHQNY